MLRAKAMPPPFCPRDGGFLGAYHLIGVNLVLSTAPSSTTLLTWSLKFHQAWGGNNSCAENARQQLLDIFLNTLLYLE